jgi:hypothetical protein
VNSEDLLASGDASVSSANSRNITTVVVEHPYIDVLFELRADYVFENDIWQLRWQGYRWKCLNDEEANWNITGDFECP